MGCLNAFQSNTNVAKDPHNVTSHFGTRSNISGENMTRPGEGKKMSQKQPKLKLIIHAFGLSLGLSSERHRIPLRDIVGHWEKKLCGLERNE